MTMDAGAGPTELGDRLSRSMWEKLGAQPARGFAGMADQMAAAEKTRGLELEDVDVLLRRRELDARAEGHQRGSEETREWMERSQQVAVSEHVAAAYDACSSQLPAAIIVAAVTAREGNKTRDEIVQAVTDAVRRCTAALDDMAARARRGEMFA